MGILGLMSGTSLDGLDIAFCKFATQNNKIIWQIEIAETLPYDTHWTEILKNAHKLTGIELTELNINYGREIGKMVNNFINKNAIHKSEIDYISSHGHTIFHQPEKGFTLQIGHGAYIAETTEINTICDFRTQDMAKGGQGAPLVPIGDRLLFGEYGCCINLGGIANLSYEKNNQRIAYDICPANMVLNYLSNKSGVNYDNNGAMAASGTVNKKLLAKLNQLNFYQQTPPKTLGREWVERNIFPLLENSKLSITNQLTTFCNHIGMQINSATAEIPKTDILITGGGAWNKFLIETINNYTSHSVVIPSDKIIDFKEALIFALLAYLRVNNKTNILSSVTGANEDHKAGIEFKIR